MVISSQQNMTARRKEQTHIVEPNVLAPVVGASPADAPLLEVLAAEPVPLGLVHELGKERVVVGDGDARFRLGPLEVQLAQLGREKVHQRGGFRECVLGGGNGRRQR